MNEPWFDPRFFAWIPGTALGVLGGLWGALAGTQAPRGRARGLVLGYGVCLLAASVLMLALGAVAWAGGQPYGVWYGFGLAGVIGTIVIGANLPNVRRAYRAAEERGMEAHDLS
jgi:hypothetical protein